VVLSPSALDAEAAAEEAAGWLFEQAASESASAPQARSEVSFFILFSSLLLEMFFIGLALAGQDAQPVRSGEKDTDQI